MLTHTQKKYLYAIYRLGGNGGDVRSAEVSRLLGVTKASTAKMTLSLIEEGYIQKAHYGRIVLTDNGIKVANSLYTQCLVISNFLRSKVGVHRECAENDAISIVSFASDETVDKMVSYLLEEA